MYGFKNNIPYKKENWHEFQPTRMYKDISIAVSLVQTHVIWCIHNLIKFRKRKKKLTFIWVNCAKWEVFSIGLTLGQNIEECWLPRGHRNKTGWLQVLCHQHYREIIFLHCTYCYNKTSIFLLKCLILCTLFSFLKRSYTCTCTLKVKDLYFQSWT